MSVLNMDSLGPYFTRPCPTRKVSFRADPQLKKWHMKYPVEIEQFAMKHDPFVWMCI